ncbi:MAG: hypothetical protein A2268_01330 [Candidatus Raymondbacteria bacterium RifOxyA12_full_50_37]|nr:MAG: hypothetical protein A2268_01330 [Candidatus Raymondbacteria bacterium RifOxyA12_full_50_37]OGJ92435.1 MAG: hypothetical protein A2248_11625 [Candidatus Raymondbacteria bacterium RIFOXYA2_FULL_49_16]OGJ98856.1 MAG: hypothetical protein A2453_01055 [Candidatus Raymondbacteria bacterium RIFOXYC2_FULL_50_21]OGK03585.1 MAG: hypothetical protein A2350_09885 [Candidatus Raymondbacteria bacterium RifOxyB12_full_50_8]OGK04694.1 MAG: hypothetical protein A2487_14195 [Candidatus Raymondbacteria b
MSTFATLPAILIATPEIVALPHNMGNLAHVISTGDGGGLADISAALVMELDRQGANVHVALPEYRNMFAAFATLTHKDYEMLRRDLNDRSRIHLIEDGLFDHASRVYNDSSSRLYDIDARRANAFQRGIIYRVLPFLKNRFTRVLVHCNDWMTGLIPSAARGMGVKSLMTFHNIFTYRQTPHGLQEQGIDIQWFWNHVFFKDHPDKHGSFEANYANNQVDYMTSGLFAADFINTVSPTFLKEIVQNYFMEHHTIPDAMRDVIKGRWYGGAAMGILNAPSKFADPRLDTELPYKYWYEPVATDTAILDIREGKRKNKEWFQKQAGLQVNPDVPLFFWPSRIAKPQKGFELLLHIIHYLMPKFDLQIAVVANGDLDLIRQYEWYQRVYPGRITYRPFTRKLSQVGKAAADFLFMPSLYEPCGIPQVEAPRYGTIPLVRRTGGLADTVEPLSGNGLMGNGFLFQDFIPSGLWYVITRAMAFFKKDDDFKYMVLGRIMKESFENFNIEKTARQYLDVYEKIFRQTDPGVKIV